MAQEKIEFSKRGTSLACKLLSMIGFIDPETDAKYKQENVRFISCVRRVYVVSVLLFFYIAI